MNPLVYLLNTVLGTELLLILICIDYLWKYNTDKFQRSLFLSALGAMFLAIIANSAGVIIRSRGTGNNWFTADSLYTALRTVSFYSALIFIDYFLHGNIKRAKKIGGGVLILLSLYAAAVLANIRHGYFFYPAADYTIVRGKLSILEHIISRLPLLACVIDILLDSKNTRQTNFVQMFFFSLFTGLGTILDSLFKTRGLEFLGFTAAMLYSYFCIIRIDAKIDALTGIGNRYSFNEFIEKLSRRNRRGRVFHESWAVVTIDMDHFKEINDTLGHLEGDNALRDMAKIIKGCIRRSDFAARYGGDEFVLAARAETDIEKLIARLRENLACHNETAGRAYKLEISYGYDIFATGGNRTIDEFLTHIDQLMYKHKAERRRLSDRINNQEA